MRVSSEQRRRQLTTAAAELIVEEGPSAATARRIADRAGAPLSAVHYAFRDMDELMHYANGEVLNRLIQKVAPNLRTDLGVRQFIRDFLESFWRFLRDNEQEALAFFETFVALMRPGKASPPVDEARKRMTEFLQMAEQHDPQPSKIEPQQLAILLTMTVDGLSLIHLSRSDPEQTERDVEQLVTALQHLV